MIIQLIPSRDEYKKIQVLALEKDEVALDGGYGEIPKHKRIWKANDKLTCNLCGLRKTRLNKCIVYPRQDTYDVEEWIVCPHNSNERDGNIVLRIKKAL